MLKKRNSSAHIYNEDEIDETVLMIRDSFIPAFVLLERTLQKKLGGDGGPDGGTPDSRSRAGRDGAAPDSRFRAGLN